MAFIKRVFCTEGFSAGRHTVPPNSDAAFSSRLFNLTVVLREQKEIYFQEPFSTDADEVDLKCD